MGVQGCNSKLWDSCTDFYQASLDVNNNKTLEDSPKFFNFKFDEAETEKDLKIAKKLHDHNLDKVGQRTNVHRCHPKPFDEKLRKKKKFKSKTTATERSSGSKRVALEKPESSADTISMNLYLYLRI